MIEGSDWRPSAELDTLRRRADLLRRIRQFFRQRGVLEVETPALSAATVTDLHLHSLSTPVTVPYSGPHLAPGDGPGGARTLYLQTSPEFAMKRLLAAGSGPIFQICKAFRDGEAGRRHNPEFTMLEWYRPGFDHHALMDEMDDFLGHTISAARAERLTYRTAFERWAEVDPFDASTGELADCAARHGIDPGSSDWQRDDWLHLLLSQVVEPHLGVGSGSADDGTPRPTFLYDFPTHQAALARVRPASGNEPAAAERFEVFVRGVELANGFHELTDSGEQRRRFEADLAQRRRLGLPEVPIDERLLAALEHGLPPCAGVALGVDRMFMVQERTGDLRQLIAFDVSRA